MPLDVEQLFVRIYPDPALRQRAQAVTAEAEEVEAAARQMIELMRRHEGIGLAATQVGLPWRIFVADVPRSEEAVWPDEDVQLATDGPVVYINPVLSEAVRDMTPAEEGCLSLPNIRGDVRRPSVVTMRALDLEGKPFEQRAAGLLARCLQHEVDHLDGVLIIDRMSQLSKLRVRAAVKALDQGAGSP